MKNSTFFHSPLPLVFLSRIWDNRIIHTYDTWCHVVEPAVQASAVGLSRLAIVHKEAHLCVLHTVETIFEAIQRTGIDDAL